MIENCVQQAHEISCWFVVFEVAIRKTIMDQCSAKHQDSLRFTKIHSDSLSVRQRYTKPSLSVLMFAHANSSLQASAWLTRKSFIPPAVNDSGGPRCLAITEVALNSASMSVVTWMGPSGSLVTSWFMDSMASDLAKTNAGAPPWHGNPKRRSLQPCSCSKVCQRTSCSVVEQADCRWHEASRVTGYATSLGPSTQWTELFPLTSAHFAALW